MCVSRLGAGYMDRAREGLGPALFQRANGWRELGHCCILGAMDEAYSIDGSFFSSTSYFVELCKEYFSCHSSSTVRRHPHKWRRALHIAVSNEEERLTRELLADGADVNWTHPPDGDTAVWLTNNHTLCDLLVEKGADMNLCRGSLGDGICGYYLQFGHRYRRELASMVRHIENGRLDVYPCNPSLLCAPYGDDIRLAHENFCCDLVARVDSTTGLVPDVSQLVLDYVCRGAICVSRSRSRGIPHPYKYLSLQQPASIRAI